MVDDDLFRVRVGNRDVLPIPSGDKVLQVRLMVCAHMRSASHRGVSPTLFRLKEYCVWSHNPYGDTVHGTAPGEVVHFGFLHVGSSGPEGSEGLPEEDGFRYILVIMDDLSNFVSLEPAEACTAEGYG